VIISTLGIDANAMDAPRLGTQSSLIQVMDVRRMFSHKLLMNAIDRIKFRFADRLRLNPARAVIPRCAGIHRGAGKVWETIWNQPMSQPTKQLYEFGPFRLDPVERLLYRDGEVAPLTAKTSTSCWSSFGTAVARWTKKR